MTPLRSLLLSALLLASATSVCAARRERFIDTWRPVDYNVALTLNDGLTEITKARTEVTIQILKDHVTAVDLDFGELTVDAVTIDRKATKFDQTPGLLNVHLANAAKPGSRVVIAIDYHGRPKDGLILTADKDGRPSATGDNWPNRVHHWIPCFDHPAAKATVTFNVTAPEKDIVVANGKLDRVHNDSQTMQTWTYTEGVPIPAYCMVIAVGEYAKFTPSAPSITPLSYYVPQSDLIAALVAFDAAAPSLKLYSEMIGPYPYEKLALIVGATRFGGMENSSAIVFPGTLLNRRTGPQRVSRALRVNAALEEVVAHEIAHQWFGDSVTESTWSDLWLSEGFATYFAGLVIQNYDGEDDFRAYMKRAADTYFRYEKKTRTPIHDTETEDLMNLLNANNYQKGAWVLHMLRSQLGDDAFFRGLRIYYQAHKEATANSEDLRAALEKASGKDLKEFFARWVYGTGHPQYEFSSELLANGTLRIKLRQSQSEPAFPNSLPVDVTTPKGKHHLLLQPGGKEFVKEFRLDGSPSSIEVDPGNTVLKEITVRPMM